MKHTLEESVGQMEQAPGASIGNEQSPARRDAKEQRGAPERNDIRLAEHTAIVHGPARRTDGDGVPGNRERVIGAPGYDALEIDFRAHHQTNAARRRGPYEHYRLVYRYGYDLAGDTRYRNADWLAVEQAARPRWEERNPGTWEEFKDTIRYAWDKARGQC
jgi:hypothetical protein